MRGKNRWFLAAGLAIGTLGAASVANAQALLDSSFNYQGQLKSGLNLVEVNSDFRFTVWDSAAGGVQIAGPITRSNVIVRDGVFTVNLDFGTAPFNGEARFLQIEVRTPTGVGAFQTLAPRQKIQVAPYALQAQSGNAPFNVQPPGSTSFVKLDPDGGAKISTVVGGKNAQLVFLNGDGGGLINYGLTLQQFTGFFGADGRDTSGFISLFETPNSTFDGNVAIDADIDNNPGNGIWEGGIRLSGRGAGGNGGSLRLTRNNGATTLGSVTLEARGGGDTGGGTLNLFDGSTGNSVFSLSENLGGSKDGARLSGARPNGSQFFFLEPDVDGTGGFFAVIGGAGSFAVNGNASGAPSGGPAVTISGPTSGMSFDSNVAGDGSVNLPKDAISAVEILDEPGVANIHVGNATIPASGAVGTLTSRSITVPGPGYVVVLANGDIDISHTTGTTSNYAYGVSDSATTIPVDQDIQSVVQSHEPTNFYDYSAAAHGLFTVPAAGTYTYFFNSQKFSGAGSAIVFDINLTIMYFPTAYGATQTNFTGGFVANTGNTGPVAGPMTPAQIAGERAQGEQFGRDRAMAELAQMQVRIQQLQKMIGNGPATAAPVAPVINKDQPAVEPVAINHTEGK